MGRFKAGIQAAQEVEASEQQGHKTRKAESQKAIKPENQKMRKPVTKRSREEKYSLEDRKLVNVGGFKVPQVVRDHWKVQSAAQRLPVAPFLTDCMIEAFGLPKGMSREQFETLITEGRKI